jgi:hypothetical protein
MAAKNAEPNGFAKNCNLPKCNGPLKGIVQPCKITSLLTNIWVLVAEVRRRRGQRERFDSSDGLV